MRTILVSKTKIDSLHIWEDCVKLVLVELLAAIFGHIHEGLSWFEWCTIQSLVFFHFLHEFVCTKLINPPEIYYLFITFYAITILCILIVLFFTWNNGEEIIRTEVAL